MTKPAPKKLRKINVGHLNTYHLVNKVPDLTAYLRRHAPFHLFGISETRLGDHITDDIINIPNYTIVRRDPVSPRETGLAVYIHNSIHHLVKRRKDLESKVLECLWLEFSSGPKSRPLYIGFVYRNPSADSEWYDYFLDNVEKIGLHKRDALLLGDFNIDMLKPHNTWDCIMKLVGLEQLVTQPTRVTATSSTIIDHIYTNCQSHITNVAVTDFSVSDHYPISCSYKLKAPAIKKGGHTTLTFRSFKHFDSNAFLHDLNLTPFHTIYYENDPELALNLWYHLFSSVLNKHAPMQTKRVKDNVPPPWMTKDIMKAMELKEQIRKQSGKKSPEFSKQRSIVQNMIRNSKKLLAERTINDSKNTAPIWRALTLITKGKKQSQPYIPPSLDANTFNKHFLSIAESLILNQIDNQSYTCSDQLKHFCQEKLEHAVPFSVPPLAVHEVGKFISSMSNKKSSGPDEISPKILKLSLPYIVESLTYIYNLCIQHNTFPSEFKYAKVVPLPKCKETDDINNYRPISLLSSLSKPLEKYVHQHLCKYLNQNQLLYSLQSGFRPGHSCHTAVTRIVDTWLDNINKSLITGAVFLDLRKAFDLVNHEILLTKLNLYLKNSPALDFFRSYLTQRKQVVHVNGSHSLPGVVKHGVPQGSVLGPLLFCVFINDLPLSISNAKIQCDLFADDATLHSSDKCAQTIESCLQIGLDDVATWCDNNKMTLNPTKTECTIITTRQKHQLSDLSLNLQIKGEAIQKVKQHRLLGVAVDNQLRWQIHIDDVCKSVARNAYLLSRIKTITTTDAKKIFYNAHIKSKLDYVSTVWDGAGEVHLKRLNSLQRRAIKHILPDPDITTDEKLKNLNILPLSQHHLFNKGVTMFKIWNKKVPSYITDMFRVKTSQYSNSRLDFHTPFPRLDLYKTSLLYSGSWLWNALPLHVKTSTTLTSFKKRLFRHLADQLRPP